MTNCILHQLFTCIDRISGSEVIEYFISGDAVGRSWLFGSFWVKFVKIITDKGKDTNGDEHMSVFLLYNFNSTQISNVVQITLVLDTWKSFCALCSAPSCQVHVKNLA